jgi:hypothetical protein
MAEKDEKKELDAQQAGQPGARIRWDTKSLKSSYANVCNVTSTREEVVLNFGINQSWERGQPELEVQLTDRIILSPFAAKRLSMMLSRLMGEYESRYGELKLDVQTQAPPTRTRQ